MIREEGKVLVLVQRRVTVRVIAVPAISSRASRQPPLGGKMYELLWHLGIVGYRGTSYLWSVDISHLTSVQVYLNIVSRPSNKAGPLGTWQPSVPKVRRLKLNQPNTMSIRILGSIYHFVELGSGCTCHLLPPKAYASLV